MTNPRRKFSAEEKVNILRLHLLEKQPVSDVCDKFGLNPNVFYHWPVKRKSAKGGPGIAGWV